MYRRGIYILLLVGAMVAGDLSLHAFRDGRAPLTAGHVHVIEIAAVLASLAAGAIGMAGMVTLRRRCNGMASSMHAMIAEGSFGHVGCPDSDLGVLASAINALIDYAHGAVSKAKLEAREMELRMKVATAERQHAEAIIYSISDAVLVTDAFDELVMANESAARTFEFDLSRAQRAPVAQVLPDPRLIGMIKEMRQSDSRTERRIVEHQVRTPSGGGRTYKVTLSCFADRNGQSSQNGNAGNAGNGGGSGNGKRAASPQPAGVVAVLHDMTREKELAAMKNDFVSNVSHELRTPLASIKAYVEMLIDGEADDDRTKREFYEVIQNEANRLGRLIDDILNISRIESGLVKVDRQPLSLGVIIKEAVEVIEPQARQKNVTVREGMTPIYYQTLADRDMLYQAVLNLLSNAVKYTPEGGSIEVQTTVDEASRTMTTRIADTGVGIPSKDLPFVFDKFYRAEANNRMAKGTGLGLSLVKQIIETVHGGRMFVESQVGKGSCFGFQLKLAD
jgi:two-component system, OmpR family, phosphate regulon sensor histidine kinase PhoR